jgi:ParB family chromosome partitioning protein
VSPFVWTRISIIYFFLESVMQSEPTLQHDATQTAEDGTAASMLETNFGNETLIEYVPYSRLRASPLNVRTKPLTGIPEMADNIAAKGLMQNLVVHPLKGTRGKYPKLGVCAGKRRLAALDVLFSDGRIPANHPVPVKIVTEGEAFAISLIENSVREPLDALDLIVSFKKLVEEGRSVEYIAALFNVSPLNVRRRVKLADVSPKLLALLREDGITLDQLSALALADDHVTQERLWFDVPNDWQRAPQYLRQAITRAEIDASRSRFVRFVGLDAYEAAGGYVRRDLFADEQNAGFVTDAELLHRLVAGKLEAATASVREQGWGWVETRSERDHAEINSFGRLAPTTRPYTRKEERELKKLVAHRDDLMAKYDACEGGDEEAYEEAERLEQAVNAADHAVGAFAKRAETWDAGQIGQAGAFVFIDAQGELAIERGLVKREDKPELENQGATVTGLANGERATISEPAPKEKPLHSDKLCRRLTAHHTAAVQVELAKRPGMALAVLLHRLIPDVFDTHYGYTGAADCVGVRVECQHDKLLREADDMETSTAWTQISAQRDQWLTALPKHPDDLLPWLLDQDPGTTLLDLLAFCTASSLDGIAAHEGAHPINAISNAVELDMTRYWTPTRAAYFDHVSKARIVDIVANAVSPKAAADLSSMKKADAAAAAELRLANAHWLPDVLTHHDVPIMNHYDADGGDNATDVQNGTEDEIDGELNGEPDGANNSDAGAHYHGEPASTDTIEDMPIDTPITDDSASNSPPAWPFPTSATIIYRHSVR